MNTVRVHDLWLVRSARHVDIVFVHGLGGDPFATWGCNSARPVWESGWRKLIGATGGTVNLFSVEYPSSPIDFPLSRRLSLFETAQALRTRLLNVGIGVRPVIFVCHSMGGLLIKQMLRRDQSATVQPGRFLGSTKHILFVGTPHRGAKWAQRLEFLAWPFVTSNVSSLSYLSPYLDDLHEWFVGCCLPSIGVTNFYEKRRLLGLDIVPEGALRFFSNHVEELALDKDHVSACKPADVDDPVVDTLNRLVRGSFEGVPVHVDVDVSLRQRFSFLRRVLERTTRSAQLAAVAQVVKELEREADADQRKELAGLGFTAQKIQVAYDSVAPSIVWSGLSPSGDYVHKAMRSGEDEAQHKGAWH